VARPNAEPPENTTASTWATVRVASSSASSRVAGAIVMYDRMLSLGRFSERPLVPGGALEAPPMHKHGAPIWVRRRARRRAGD